MLSLNGISAWVEVDGKELEQYGVEDIQGQNRVSCWIAAQVDKAFSVVFRDDAEFRDHSLGSYLELDGSCVGGKVLKNRNHLNIAERTVVHKHQFLSATSARPFVFSKLETTDEDEYLDQTSTHLGEIQIRIYRVQCLGSDVFLPVLKVAGHGKVHERSKKAVSHCVSYGHEVKTETQHVRHVRYLDGNTPLVTFVFKYRDFGLLQANGLIPQPPPPKKKAPVPNDVLDLTMDNDIKREPSGDEVEIVDNLNQTRRKSLQPKRSNPSRERGTRPAKRIKQEKSFVHTDEVIDLT